MKAKKFFLNLSMFGSLFAFFIFLFYTIGNVISFGGISGWIFDYFFPNTLKDCNFLGVLAISWIFVSGITILTCVMLWKIFKRLDEKHG